MQYCAQCGAERVENARFCHACGQNFPGASRQVVAIGLCGVVFLAGIAYFVIQGITTSKPEAKPVPTEHVHVEGDDHSASQAGNASQAGSASKAAPVHEQKLGATGTRFAPLETYFRNHQIMGPKVFSFKVENENEAVLYLDQFPMDQMPPAMRKTFDGKVQEQLNSVGEGVSIQIRDARNRSILAKYSN